MFKQPTTKNISKTSSAKRNVESKATTYQNNNINTK